VLDDSAVSSVPLEVPVSCWTGVSAGHPLIVHSAARPTIWPHGALRLSAAHRAYIARS
jgi:hypothetical protein